MSPIATKLLPGTTIDPRYPDSDGEPMGETGFHVAAILHLYGALTEFFRGRDDVYVAADMFMYYEEGNPSACKAPDVMVSIGVVGKHERRSFRTWEEGVAPTVIFEVTSKKTRQEDLVAKPQVYAALGVKEYFRFDPENDGSEQALAGFRLQGGAYRPLAFDTAGRLTSQELGLSLEVELPLLRMIDLQTGTRLPTLTELTEQSEQFDATQRELDAMRDQAQAAHEQVLAERERAQVERERAQAERERAQAERERAQAERERADAERRRATQLEAELARLRAAQTRPQPPM